MVIVECGFLSNPEEAELLTTEEYQKKIAAAIRKGILNYWKQKETPEEEMTMTGVIQRGIRQRI